LVVNFDIIEEEKNIVIKYFEKLNKDYSKT